MEPGVTFVVKAFANEGHEDVVQHNIDMTASVLLRTPINVYSCGLLNTP